MFKVGDRIRRVHPCNINHQVVVGGIYTVSEILNHDWIMLEEHVSYGTLHSGGFAEESFELVKPEAPSITKQDNVRVRIAVEGQTTRAFGSLTEAKTYAGRYYLTTGIVPKLHVFQDFHLDWTPDVH